MRVKTRGRTKKIRLVDLREERGERNERNRKVRMGLAVELSPRVECERESERPERAACNSLGAKYGRSG